jgi:DNA-binding XRE family transcriptional regulator
MRSLAEYRRAKALSQTQLARQLGLSQSAIGMYEAGRRTPGLRIARRIAAFFGVGIDDIDFLHIEKRGGDDGETRKIAS